MKSMKSMFNMETLKKRIYPPAAALLVTAVIGAGALSRVDRWWQDWLFQNPGVTSPDIVIIGIDEYAFEELGPYNTWDRNVMASALEALASDPENKPAVVAIDVLYTGYSTAQADERLVQAASELGNVVTASLAEFGEDITWEDGHAVAVDPYAILNYEQPFPELKACTQTGHINAMSDIDSVMRHALLYIEPDGPDGERIYSMACETARKYLALQEKELSYPPVGKRGHFYIPFTGRHGAYYDGVSIAHLISGAIPSGYWANKIVLIGPYAAALQDAYFTPIDKGEQMYGVEFQANVIQSLLESRFKKEITEIPQLLLLFLLLTAAAALLMRLKILPGTAIGAGFAALGFICPVLLYKAGLILHPLYLPAGVLAIYILSLANHYVRAARERHALALEKERLGAELALATRIQANALPNEFPPFPNRHEFDVFASMTPAKEVGGDLYDFFLIDDDHLCLAIGDVSGKGVPAALFMMVAMTLIRHVAKTEKSPSKVLEQVNREICARNPEEMFVTVWLGVLEISTGILTAANAGHEYPTMKNPDGEFELVKDKHGFVIGGLETSRYREYTLQLVPGSMLFVYTDGVAEATDSTKTLFGTDRMLTALRSVKTDTPEHIVSTVGAAVQAFVGTAPQVDDLTMLCIQYQGVNAPSFH